MHVFDARAQLITVAENTADISIKDETASIESAAPIHAQPESESPSNTTEIASTEIASTEVTADTASQLPSYLGDAVKKNRLRPGNTGKSRTWLWAFASLILVLTAGLQSIYFLRDEIAIYYPVSKPYLLQACQKLACTINLPKKIDFIVIDDSDMQEDAEHAGIVRFASTLINHGNHVVAYPNLELTLTDVDDKPVLRRIFKPNEYLAAGTNIADGIQSGAETRINLAVTTSDIAVAGYRVFVTY